MSSNYKRQPVEKYILKVLQNLGGTASRQRIKEEIVADEEIDISHDDAYEPKSSRSGRTYFPFDYDLNFGIKHLNICGLIEPYKRGADISLTEEGRAADYKLFPSSEQQEKMDAYWSQKKVERLSEKKGRIEIDDELSEEEAFVHDDDLQDDWRSEVLERIKLFSPKKFESFSRLLLSKMGIVFDSEKGVKMSGDHGIDGYGTFVSDEFRTSKVVVQCKRFTESSVSEPEIDKFKGVMDSFNADYGIFVTTSYFTKTAREKAVLGGRTVTLIDGQNLVDLIVKYQLHVSPRTIYTLDEYYFQKD